MLSGAPSKPQMRIGANRATRETKGAQPDEFTPSNDEDVTRNTEDEATTEIAGGAMGTEPNKSTLPKDQDLSDKIVIENPPLPLDQVIVSHSTKSRKHSEIRMGSNFSITILGIDIFITSGDGRAPMEASVMSCDVNVTIAFGDLGRKFRFTCEDKNPAIPSSAEQGMNDCGTHNFHVKCLGNISGASADGMEDENESLDPKN
ncbi:hypothetical protein VPH35_042647 [Triticum aestivum]